MSTTTVQLKYILYGSARSSCAWRVRAALAYKKLPFEYRPVSIYTGEQHTSVYKSINPAEMIPALVVPSTSGPNSTETLFESLAIIAYLEQVHPTPALYPTDPIAQAHATAIAEMIVSNIQPLSSFKFMKIYSEANEGNQKAALTFSQNWIETKFDKLEIILQKISGTFTVGDTFSLADICLVPQIYTAIRYKINIDKWPILKNLYEKLSKHEAIEAEKPENMPDFGSGGTFVDAK